MLIDAAVAKPEEASTAGDTSAPTPKDAAVLAHYSPAHRAIEILSIAAFLALCLWLIVRMGSATHGARWWLLGAAALGGYVLADFVSGLVHWGFDTWGSIYTPVLGKNFIRPFREHHFDEKAITRHDFVETNGNNCLVALPVLTACTFVPVDGSLGLAAVAVLTFMCLGVFGTNQFHKWAHMDNPPRLVGWLQRWHLVLPPAHHDTHHRAPYDNYYCITTGWLNSSLRFIGFFRHLERVITAVTGRKPRVDDLAP